MGNEGTTVGISFADAFDVPTSRGFAGVAREASLPKRLVINSMSARTSASACGAVPW